MPSSILKQLTETQLKAYAGFRSFARGKAYYRSGRVTLESADFNDIRCFVRGTRKYWVRLWLENDDFAVMCTCPYAEAGWFCKHMVAAGLAAYAYLKDHGPDAWRLRLSNYVENIPKKTKPKTVRPYWFFLSLRSTNYGWRLFPYKFLLDRIPEGLLPPNEAITNEHLQEVFTHNQWLLDHVKMMRSNQDALGCANCSSEELAISGILLQQERLSKGNYYYGSGSYPLSDYLTVLAQSELPIFQGSSYNPMERWLQVCHDPAEFRLLIKRLPDSVQIIATLFVKDQIVDLTKNQGELLTVDHPIWLKADNLVTRVDSQTSIELLNSWLRTPEIIIPSEDEDEFLESYLLNLAERVPIESEGITWVDIDADPINRLYLTDEDGELQVQLRFGYQDFEVPYDPVFPAQTVKRIGDDWTLARIKRNSIEEEKVFRSASSAAHGIKRGGKKYSPNVFVLRARVDPIDFLMRHVPRLTKGGFEIYGEEKLKTARVNRNKPSLSLNVSSGIDWFDLNAVVKFGEVETSLKEIRKALRKKDQYVKLADGTIGEIPDEWITRYKHLFGLGEQSDHGMRFSNHHLTLVDQLLTEADRSQYDAEFSRRRERLMDFAGINEKPLPRGFTGQLRPYQKAGYDWLHFLHEYRFGGCLADDMGLGKTVETLVFLQSLRESNHTKKADLIVLPRSLLVNWQREAGRFVPDLCVYQYFGKERKIYLDLFDENDLILTTYGTMLRDIVSLRKHHFHYVILDESQAIKNPLAKTSKAARLLLSDHRLVLTGTPVENSTFELWSQFAFLNPGLLGNLEYFKREFGNPIERNGDEKTAQLLRKMVYPFILRRTKERVAPELPPRTERVIYSDMEPAQRNFYNKTRDFYRAKLMGVIENKGMNSARMQVLEGLLRLRQICNHPKLVRSNFRGDSAKFNLLMETLETLQSEDHKALIFSQFVQMLTLVRKEMDKRKIPYIYLDGRTRKRQERVDTFQNEENIPFFLISLKAGGVGLNLTAADYVIHIDPWWNPAVEMQASDRTHRIGQEKPVFIYKLIVRDSIEEKILQLQDRKRALVDQLISTESSFFKSLTADDVQVLFS